jgi:hypothetical protein
MRGTFGTTLLRKKGVMKLERQITKRETKAPKTSVEAITRCPRCGYNELIPIDTDVLCGRCPWDSCKASVDAGHMDHFFSEGFRGWDESHVIPLPNYEIKTDPRHEAPEPPNEISA